MPQASAPEQLVVQAQESLQSTPAMQASRALHETSQGPPPHSTGPAQAPFLVHWIVHSLAAVQSTPPAQESTPLQTTRQGSPGGHSTPPGQEPPAVQKKTQVPLSQ